MLQTPMDVLEQFPIRKTKKQKQAFRHAVCNYLQNLGYMVTVEKGRFSCQNVVIGDPENAHYLITAHYDTPAKLLFPNFITPCNASVFCMCKFLQWFSFILLSSLIGAAAGLLLGEQWISLFCALSLFGMVAVMIWGPPNSKNANDNTSGVITLMEIARTMPASQRHKVCFVLFDLEELGLIGSDSYRNMHKSVTDHQLVLNLDCVGDGDHILMIPTKQLKKDRKQLTRLFKACGYWGRKSILVKDSGFSVYPSDQRSFPYGVGICALHKGKCGYYISKIHTSRDTNLDLTNVNILRAALTSFISCDAVN